MSVNEVDSFAGIDLFEAFLPLVHAIDGLGFSGYLSKLNGGFLYEFLVSKFDFLFSVLILFLWTSDRDP